MNGGSIGFVNWEGKTWAAEELTTTAAQPETSSQLGIAYWFMVIVGVLIPAGVFLLLGYQAAGSVTPQNQSQIVAVMASFLTVDGLLLGLRPRFKRVFASSDKLRLLANLVEAFQIAVLTLSLMWSLVAMLYAAFSTDISLVSLWFKTALGAFFFAVSIYSSFAILTRQEDVGPKNQPPANSSGTEQGPSNAERLDTERSTDEDVAGLVARVDKEFSLKKLPSLRPWVYFAIGVVALVQLGALIFLDLSVRVAIVIGGAAVVIPLVQIILDHYDSWVTNDNYRRMLRKEKQNLLLYALVLMKTAAPGLLLGEAYKLNPRLFDSPALIASIYRVES